MPHSDVYMHGARVLETV